MPKKPACGACVDAGTACGADTSLKVCARELRSGRLQGHQPLCPYQAGEVLRRDRRLSAGINGNEKSPKRRSCRPAFE